MDVNFLFLRNKNEDTSWGENFIQTLAQLAQSDPAAFCNHMKKEIVEKLDYWKSTYSSPNLWEIFCENMAAVISVAQLSNRDPKIRQNLIKLCDEIGLPE